MKGPYVYAKVDDLEGEDKVSNLQCASLVQYYAKAPLTKFWRKGIEVRGNAAKIKRGTAVATFVDGKYPHTSHNKHAAFYLNQAEDGVWVMDQWDSDNKPTISKRFMRFKGTNKDGSFIDPANNGDALSVIMSEP